MQLSELEEPLEKFSSSLPKGRRRTDDFNQTITVILNYVKSFTVKTEKNNNEIEIKIKKINQQLNDFLNITQDIAVIQQQQAMNTESINYVKTTIREQIQKLENISNKTQLNIKELSDSLILKIELDMKKVLDKFTEAEQKHKHLDSRFQKWLNLGIGGWSVMISVLGIVLYSEMKWIESIDKDKTVLTEKIQKLSSRIEDIENRFFQQIEPKSQKKKR